MSKYVKKIPGTQHTFTLMTKKFILVSLIQQRRLPLLTIPLPSKQNVQHPIRTFLALKQVPRKN